MDDDTGGLLQDEDLRVLEDNGQRGGLRKELLGGGGRDFHLDALAAREPCRGLPDRAVDADAAGLDQRPEPHPGELRQPVGEPTVERSEEHTSELQSLAYLVCRLLLEKKKTSTTRDI